MAHTDPLYTALLQKNCNLNFGHIISMDDTMADALTYTDAARNVIDVPDHDKLLIKQLRAFYSNVCRLREEQVDWFTLSADDFNDYAEGGGYRPGVEYPPWSEIRADIIKNDRKAEVEATAKAKATASLTPKAETFRRSIKKDPAAYPVLAEEDDWDTWDRKFRATAAIHGLSNVTDAGFKPVGREARDLFNEQNKFLYNVLNTKVTLAEGMAIVRKHEREFDAQEALVELRNFFVESPRAIFKRDELYREITATRMAELNWNGTVTDCILNWTEKLRKYENGAPDPSMITTAENKKRYLQAFVDGYHGFEHVRTQENMRQAMGDRVDKY